jgi:Tat protein translocase TatB subunit
MFGMSMTEMMIILVVALIVLGPNDLPKAAKTIGKTIRDLQRAGDDLRDTFQREIMEEPTKPKAPPQGAVAVNAPKDQPPAEAKPELPAAVSVPVAALPPSATEGEPVARTAVATPSSPIAANGSVAPPPSEGS